MEFSEKQKALRAEQDLTQEQLAQHLYVTRTAVSRWETRPYRSCRHVRIPMLPYGSLPHRRACRLPGWRCCCRACLSGGKASHQPAETSPARQSSATALERLHSQDHQNARHHFSKRLVVECACPLK